MDNHNVAIYVRVSTLEQAENNWSIEGQLQEIRTYCDRKGYKIIRIYKDEGYSGKDIERPALQTMLEYASLKRFDKIIIWRYDRLSRNDVDFPALLHLFKKLDVPVESVNEPTASDGSPYNEFVVGILGLVSSLERRVFLMRSRMGMKVRLRNGFYKGSHPPYGYDYNKDTGHLDINEVESNAVKLIYEKYLEFESLHAVKTYLTKENIPTKRGGKWCISTVRNVLKNKVYLGYYIYGDIETKHEEIRLISDELFEKVQAKLEERHDYGPSKYYNKEVEKYRNELHWGNNTDNPVIQEYLTKKAEMPECPRCGKNMYVSKWGKHHSPTAGELQQYYCKPCNYEFMLFPELPPREDVVKCPKCGTIKNVSKAGIYHNKTHGIDIQKYHCKKCNYCFQISPKRFHGWRPTCPKCSSRKVYSSGRRKWNGGQEYQIWECQDCGKCFSEEIIPGKSFTKIDCTVQKNIRNLI